MNPHCDPAGPLIGSLVVNLSGTQKARFVESSFAGGAFGSRLAPMVFDVAQEEALATLERIERSGLGLTILPFCALMKGAGEPAFIERWKLAVLTEPESARRLQYRDWAVILSDLTQWQVDWHRATEGWMELESPTINGWLARGEERGELRNKREYLLEAIRLKFRVRRMPEAIRRAVEGTHDMAKLDEWFRAVFSAESVADLRKAMAGPA
ncbi:MAG: hypothetical protein K2W96_07160 [Gemmataceae bacterium]|nr:hypothetical protein [Gemmataceae bacterium]